MEEIINDIRERQEQVRTQQIAFLQVALNDVEYRMSKLINEGSKRRLQFEAQKLENEIESWTNMSSGELQGYVEMIAKYERHQDLQVSYHEHNQGMV